jgi:hypothetical protein
MELDSKIVKQAVRDAASKDPGLSDQAVQYFASLSILENYAKETG